MKLAGHLEWIRTGKRPDGTEIKLPAASRRAITRHFGAKAEGTERAKPTHKLEVPCVHLGEQLRVEVCQTCGRKGTPAAVFSCAKHGECTLRSFKVGVKNVCIGCDHKVDAPKQAMTWAVGIVTAPRANPTLETTLKSVWAAGWMPVVYAEPDSPIPADAKAVKRPERLGLWRNWLKTAGQLLSADTSHVLICEDDVELCPDARRIVEGMTWPADVGCVSLYTASPYHRDSDGIHDLPTGNFWGACALAFPAAVLRKVLDHKFIRGWSSDKGTDQAVGKALEAMGLRILGFSPSLGQHIGETSTHSKRANEGNRKAKAVRRTAKKSNDCLIILQPRRIPAAIQSIEALDIDKLWLTGFTEPELAPHLNAFIRDTAYPNYWLVADDVIVPPEAFRCVQGLLDRHDAATGYCRLAADDPRVNLTRKPLRAPGGRVGWKSYDFFTLDELQRTEGEVTSHFGGWALTGMRRELWLRFPFEVNRHSRCQTDAQTALRMAAAGLSFVTHRDSYIEHLKRDPNQTLDDGWLVGHERPCIRWERFP